MSSPSPADAAPMTAEMERCLDTGGSIAVTYISALDPNYERLQNDIARHLFASETARAAAEGLVEEWKNVSDSHQQDAERATARAEAAEAQAARLREALRTLDAQIESFDRTADVVDAIEDMRSTIRAALTPPSQEGDGRG